MKRYFLLPVIFLFILSIGVSNADTRKYTVKIFNGTKGQDFSKVIVFTGESSYNFFKIGKKASDALEDMAEKGSTTSLESTFKSKVAVNKVVVSDKGIDTGDTLSLEITSIEDKRRMSVVGSLESTNDTFFAIRTVKPPKKLFNTKRYFAFAYDAGSEENNEDKDDVGDSGGSSTSEDIHFSTGIKGIKDLVPSDTDWRGPVAEIQITRIE